MKLEKREEERLRKTRRSNKEGMTTLRPPSPVEEDRRRRVRGDLRGLGPADAGERGAEGGVGPAAQTGAEDGGGGAEEAAG